VDQNGCKKVYEIDNYPGVFKDSKGTRFDLRPMDTCPSVSNFAKKDTPELQSLLMKAYEAQLQQLLDLHKKGTQYDRLYVVKLIGSLQAKIKKLSRRV
jgi:hypothetical protein